MNVCDKKRIMFLVLRQVSELEDILDTSPSISIIQKRLRKHINSITEMVEVDGLIDLDVMDASNTQDSVMDIRYKGDFITRLRDYVYEKSQDSTLNQEIIAEEFNLSKSSFYRKVKSQTGLSPNNFIKEIRLQKAKEILEKKPEILLKQIALEVGFSHYTYFSKIYTQRFGMKPINKDAAYKYTT